MSGQSIVDRLNAAKHTVAGSALGRAVVKATTEEIMPPKRKHLDYLLQSTSEINVSIPQMADLLIERTQNASWVVTFKSLIVIHHLMCYGNERFSQYMASHSSKFSLNNFIDKSGVQGVDMSSYIRKYANYLNEKRETYKLMGFDFCKVKRGKDDGMLRTMNTEKSLKTLPILHQQLEALIQFDVQPNELTNGVINACFILLSKDLIRLFACYNDGIINLLEKYFEMNKKNCKEALDIYKKFLDSTDRVSAFLKVAESAGMDKGDIPDLTKAPSSLLEALEGHLMNLENKKTTTTNSAAPAASAKPPSSVTNAINSLSSNVSLSQEEKRRVIEEEAKTLEQFKPQNRNNENAAETNHLKKQSSLSSPTNEHHSITTTVTTTAAAPQPAKSAADDIFGLDFSNTTSATAGATANGNSTSSSSGSNDLLMLNGGNPFLQNLVSQSSYGAQANPFQMPQPTATAMFPPASMPNPMMVNSNANTKLDFDAFGGDVLTPSNVLKPQNSTTTSAATNGDSKAQPEKKIISTDLDSTLASLADNLDIKSKGFQKNHQWTPEQQLSNIKTGGNDWKPMKTNSFATTPTSAPMMQAPMWTAPAPMVPPQAAAAASWNNNPFMAQPSMAAPMGAQAGFMGQPRAPLQPQVRPATTTSSTNPFGF